MIYGANNQGIKDFVNNKQTIYKQDQEEIRSLRFAKACANYAELVIRKQDKRLNINDWKELAHKYDNRYSKHFIVRRFKRLMNLPEAKIMANSALVQHLTNLKLNNDKPFKLLLKCIDIAEKKEDASTLFKVADKLLQLNGHDIPKTRVTIREEHKHSSIEYNKYKKENKELKDEYKKSKDVEFKEVEAVESNEGTEKSDTNDNTSE